MTGRIPVLRTLALVGAFSARQVCWTRRSVFGILLLLIPCVLVVVVRSQAPPGTINDFQREALPNMLLFLTEILCLFHGASVIRDAIEDRTISYLLVRPMGRSPVVMGMYVGLLGYLIPMTAISVAAAFFGCHAGLPAGWLGSPEDREAFVRLVSVIMLAVMFYGALFVLFGLIFSSPTIVGLIFLVIADGALASLPGAPRRLAPMAYFETLLAPHFRTRADIGPFRLEGPTPFVSLLTLGILFIAIMFLIHGIARGKDFVTGDKANAG
jgi:hypothetical protein